MWRNHDESFLSSTMAKIEGDSFNPSTMESDSDGGCSFDSSTMAGNCSFSPSAEGISIYERQIDSIKLRVYTVNFFGTAITATVTSTAAVARRWIYSTRYFNRHYYYSNRLIAGIGVQWVPGSKFSPAVTLQICVGRRCLIYQLANAVRFPTVLRRFLLSQAVTLVGIWNHSDAQKLALSRHHVQTKELIDLRRYVRRENGESMRRASMEEIVEEYLGYEGVGLDHWVSRSDWDNEILSFDQVRQACVDAYVSFEIGKKIRAWEI